MKIKITSNGDPQNTKCFNAETGDEIRGILSVEWRVRAGERATVKLEFYSSAVNLGIDES